jgi:hypothetical protein
MSSRTVTLVIVTWPDAGITACRGRGSPDRLILIAATSKAGTGALPA